MTDKKQVSIIHQCNAGIWPCVGIMFVQGFSYEEMVKEFVNDNCKDWAEGIKHDKELIDSAKYLALRRIIPGDDADPRPTDLYYIILQDPFNHEPMEYARLAHEVIHICQFLFEICNAHPIEEKEAFAYTHTHIMEQVLTQINKSEEINTP